MSARIERLDKAVVAITAYVNKLKASDYDNTDREWFDASVKKLEEAVATPHP